MVRCAVVASFDDVGRVTLCENWAQDWPMTICAPHEDWKRHGNEVLDLVDDLREIMIESLLKARKYYECQDDSRTKKLMIATMVARCVELNELRDALVKRDVERRTATTFTRAVDVAYEQLKTRGPSLPPWRRRRRRWFIEGADTIMKTADETWKEYE